MRACWWVLLLCILAAFHTQAQKTPPDSLRTHHLNEVPIEGARAEKPAAELNRLQAFDLSRLLRHIPDVYLRQYGPSGASSISLNGLSPSQTALEWNGIVLNSPLLGQVDANQFMAGGNRLVRGGSSLFSATQAGVLGLATAPPDSGLSLSANGMAGSFGQVGSGLSVGLQRGAIGVLGRVQWNEARNNYLVQDATQPSMHVPLPNARTFRRQAEGHVWHSDGDWNGQIHSFIALWGRHLAPSDQSLLTHTQESLYGTNAALSVSEIFDKSRDSLRIQSGFLNESYHYGYAFEAMPSERYAFTRFQGRVGYFRRFGTSGKLGVDYEAVEEHTPLLQTLGRRQRYLHFLTPKFLWNSQNVGAGGILYRGRFYWTPRVTLSRGGVQVTVRRTFRAPTFNDLYYPVYGRADLLPEQGYHGDIGGRLKIFSIDNLNILLNSNLGIYRFDHYILWLPVSNLYQPTNLLNISNIYINTKLEFNLNVTNIDMRFSQSFNLTKAGIVAHIFNWPSQQLLYTPIIQSQTDLVIDYSGFGFAFSGRYVGKRYTKSDQSEKSILIPFFLVNCNLSYSGMLHGQRYSTYLAIDNIFGEKYEWIQSYPMPFQAFRLGLQVELHH